MKWLARFRNLDRLTKTAVIVIAIGIFIRFKDIGGNGFLLLVRHKKIESYHRPDLSGMKPEMHNNEKEMLTYLSEKHLLPIQGLFVKKKDWYDWMEERRPWKFVRKALKSGSANMVPNKLGLRFLIFIRAVFGI